MEAELAPLMRRPKGSGSIFRRGSGLYEGTITIAGERYRASGTTEDEVAAKLRHLRADVERDRGPKRREPLTVEAFLRDWLEKQVHGRREDSTYRGYGSYIERHIIPAIGAKQLAQLTAREVQAMINGAKLAPASIRQLRAVLRKALHDAERWDLVERNVVRLTEGPRVRKHQTEPLTPAQARTFLRAIAGDRLEAVYCIGIGCGLRIGEALGLRWSDLGEGTLTVRGELQRIAGGYRLKEYPKTDESQRRLAVPPFAWQALDRQRARQTNAGDWGLIFTTDAGLPVNGSWVTHHLYDVLARAKLPRQSFHDLRHAFASILIDQGADLKEVQGALGHAQISLTANLYSHLYDSARERSAERIERAIGGGTP